MKDKIKQWVCSHKCRKAFSSIVFCIVAWNLFLTLTNLFRDTSYFRNHITDIKGEQQLDVVYVGGSAAFKYWQVPRAWAEYGITSYNYATNSIPAEAILGSIKEVRKTQDSPLFVVDLRPFQYWESTIDEAGIRRVSDSMDYSWNRLETIYRCLKNRNGEDIDAISYYFDLAKYHGNYNALGTLANWKWADNRDIAKYNGYEILTKDEMLNLPDNVMLYSEVEMMKYREYIRAHAVIREPMDFVTDDCAELQQGSYQALTELLEYCNEEDLKVLFVVCPYGITKEHQKLYNSMEKLIAQYGLDYLNANEFYDEMGLDFARDYYDRSHVNVFGAEKYTRFLAEYIQQKYQLKDHRKESGMESWDEMYAQFESEDAIIKRMTEQSIIDKKELYLEGRGLRGIDNVYEWCAKAQNGYVLFIETQGQSFKVDKSVNQILKIWGISEENTDNQIRVYLGETLLYANDEMLDVDYRDFLVTQLMENVIYEINCGEKATIKISGIEYCKNQEGINIVVYDKNYCEVLDTVVIYQEKDGELAIRR